MYLFILDKYKHVVLLHKPAVDLTMLASRACVNPYLKQAMYPTLRPSPSHNTILRFWGTSYYGLRRRVTSKSVPDVSIPSSGHIPKGWSIKKYIAPWRCVCKFIPKRLQTTTHWPRVGSKK
jgi:hypothetical protein